MSKILKIELLLSLALSFLIVFSSFTGISTFNYVEVLKIVEIILIILSCILIIITKNKDINVGTVDLVCVGTYLALIILILLRGYITPSINMDYYFDGPVKRIMYFSYYSYVIMFPLTILVGYIVTLYIKNIRLKKRQN